MTGTFLPGTLRQRMAELMGYFGISQSDLANFLDMSESALSRFLSGKTNSFSQEKLIVLANLFNISTDFLLGLSNNPKRGTIELQNLGLSSVALSNLLNHRFHTAGLNTFLENPENSVIFAQMVECVGKSARGYSSSDNQRVNEMDCNPLRFLTDGEREDGTGK